MVKFIRNENGQAGETFGKSFIKKMLADERGQAGAVFRLMVDAIVGIAILAMIISTLNYFEYLKVQSSLAEFNQKVLAASQSPDGSVIVSNGDLSFVKGTTFTANQMQELTGYPAQCFTFITNRSLVNTGNSGNAAEILENTDTKVYTKCTVVAGAVADLDDPDICEIECDISFGKKLETDIIRTK